MPVKRRRLPPASSSSSTKNASFTIKNKMKRSSHNVSVRRSASAAKLAQRMERRKIEAKDPSLKRQRLLENIPQTLDSKRVPVGLEEQYVPSTEIMEMAKKRKEELEDRDGSAGKMDDDDEDSDEDMEDGIRKAINDDTVAINIEGGEDDGEDEDEKEEDSAEEDDDLGSLYDSDSDDSDAGPLKKKRIAQKPTTTPSASSKQSQTLPEETLKTILSLIPHPTTPPKLLLTTTRRARRHDLYQSLSLIFPNTTYVPRGTKFTIPQIASFATNRQYTHLLVALEDSKTLHGLIILLLPAGPTFHFSLTNFADGKAIQGRGVNTNHIPELILNNFTTAIGRLTAALFQSLYPPQPQFMGRQVVTLHNQRDYIFFRFHRYIFREIPDEKKGISRRDRTTGAEAVGLGGNRAGEDLGIKVGLQELGPQFTLKLRRVERGVCEGIEWEWKGRMEKDRKMFHL
ncbi:hypothetical protein TWF730_001723 [Orbilia blumenaviensis]|uniref:Brix domain-containing protein n=1 Tax=Orbilia blumenaviensis TaxID=1796055 RepID=A0AAV9UJF6_9PEZI